MNNEIVARKIIFLDIDGVLNTEHFLMNVARLEYSEWIDPLTILILNRIVKETGAEIVISSSWRIGKTVEWFQTFFDSLGGTFKVHSKTRDFLMLPDKDIQDTCRGDEIQDWIEKNVEFHEVLIFSYAIVDDDDDMLDHQKTHFFQTDFEVGLTEEIANKIVDSLNRV